MSEGDSKTTMIGLILILVVLAVVIFGIMNFNVFGRLQNLLPEFMQGDKSDMYYDAKVLGQDVKILLSDEEGRCVIVETPSSYSWLKNYGLRGRDLEFLEGEIYIEYLGRASKFFESLPAIRNSNEVWIQNNKIEELLLPENSLKREEMDLCNKLILNERDSSRSSPDYQSYNFRILNSEAFSNAGFKDGVHYEGLKAKKVLSSEEHSFEYGVVDGHCLKRHLYEGNGLWSLLYSPDNLLITPGMFVHYEIYRDLRKACYED